MKFRYTKNFLKNYKKLPQDKQKKADKQLKYLQENFYHPSLKTKRYKGKENVFEFRVDYHYRMTGEKRDDELILRSVGPHDEGLGKK